MASYSRDNVASVENMATERQITGETTIKEITTETTTMTKTPLQQRMQQLWKNRPEGSLFQGKERERERP